MTESLDSVGSFNVVVVGLLMEKVAVVVAVGNNTFIVSQFIVYYF